MLSECRITSRLFSSCLDINKKIVIIEIVNVVRIILNIIISLQWFHWGDDGLNGAEIY